MSTDYLIKDIIPAVPATPDVLPTGAIRGTPASPAYCIDASTPVPEYRNVCVLRAGIPHTVGDPPEGTCLAYVSTPTGNYVAGPTTHTCFDAVAGTPDIPAHDLVPGSPGSPADYQAGWTGFARSVTSQAGDFSYLWHVLRETVGIVTGVTDSDTTHSYGDIKYGIHFEGGFAQAIENGVLKGDPVVADVNYWNIQRIGDVVAYYNFNEDVPFYVSTIPSTGTMYAHAWLYYGGDEVLDAEFDDSPFSVAPTYPGSVAGTLGPLLGFAGDGACSVNGELDGLVANINNTFGVLGGLSGTAGQPLTPQYAACYGRLQPLLGFSLASPRTEASVTGVLGPLTGYSSQNGKAELHGVLTRVGLVPLILINMNWVQGVLGGLVGGIAPGHARGIMTYGGHLRLFAYGTQDTDNLPGFHGVVDSAFTLNAYGGGYLRKTTPRLTLSASGTTTILGEAELTVPSLRLLATGQGTVLGRAYLQVDPVFTLNALGGAQASMSVPSLALHATGLVGIYGSARLTYRGRLSLTASGTVQNFGRVAGVLQGLSRGNSGVYVATFPRVTLYSSGEEDVTVEYEAYSMTLIDTDKGEATATTHYTNYPFDRIVRFGSIYYGVATDGLYELEGDDFDGTPIVAVVKSAETDHGEENAKRPVSMFLSGRMGVDVAVTVNTDELVDATYVYKPVHNGARNYRVMFGKGVRAKYLTYTFTNTAGEDFALDAQSFELDVLGRSK